MHGFNAIFAGAFPTERQRSKKSSDNQCEQAELNVLRCQWRTDVSSQLPRIQLAECVVMERSLLAQSGRDFG
jgi:hypothetical protein